MLSCLFVEKAIIAKSSVVIDVKTWGDEVDMKEMEALVRGIEMDGLVWGASMSSDNIDLFNS